MNPRYLVLLTSVLVVSCGKPDRARTESAHRPPEAAPQGPAAQVPGAAATIRRHFGAPFRSLPPSQLAEILAEPARFTAQPVRVEAVVRRVCSRKGCWMELSTSAEADAPRCRVTFENYSFFVPTDSAGSMALVEARVQLTQVAASHVAHLESEGGTFRSKNADGSANEVQLIATGVELWHG